MAAFVVLGLLVGCPPPQVDDPPPTPTPTAPAPTPDAKARGILERVVAARCQDPADPWALVHGILVSGPELKVAGELAIERLVVDNVELGIAGMGFPAKREGRLIEPHPGTFAKTLLELGVAADRRFTTPSGRQVSLAELVDTVTSASKPGEGALPFHNEAWQLEVLAHAAAVDASLAPQLADVRARALATLAANQDYFQAHVDGEASQYEKPFTKVDGRRAPAEIHRYYCGGLHFFQAVQRLHGAELPTVLAEQYRLLQARIRLEGDYWDRKAAQALARFDGDEALAHQRVIGSQQLKLLGHALETLLRARQVGALPKTPQLTASLEDGFRRLAETVIRLEAVGAYRDLDAIRARTPQVYLDLVGDSAHALHAFVLRDMHN